MTAVYWDPITPDLRDDPYPLWKRMRDEARAYDSLPLYTSTVRGPRQLRVDV